MCILDSDGRDRILMLLLVTGWGELTNLQMLIGVVCLHDGSENIESSK